MRLLFILMTYAFGVLMGVVFNEFANDKYTDALILEFKKQKYVELEACNRHWKQAIIDSELE